MSESITACELECESNSVHCTHSTHCDMNTRRIKEYARIAHESKQMNMSHSAFFFSYFSKMCINNDFIQGLLTLNGHTTKHTVAKT